MDKDSQVEIKVFRGKEILPYIQMVAELRISVFSEYPYLYEGTLEDEESYLSMYSESKNSIFVIAKEQDQVIGVVTGLPIEESKKEIKYLFAKKNISTKQIFYLGEMVLFQKYREKNNESMMYQQFEKVVKDIGVYEQITFCEIVRDENDLKCSVDYKSLDNFWNVQGYVKYQDLMVHFSWKEIGAVEETKHPMIFWTKELSKL